MVPLRPPGVRKAAEKKGKRVRGPGGWPELLLDKTETQWQKTQVQCDSHTHADTVSFMGLGWVCELLCHTLSSRSPTWPGIQTRLLSEAHPNGPTPCHCHVARRK